jgi:pimeloyl-ACP methyl ester carboxylesterase
MRSSRGASAKVPQLWLYAERDSFTSEGQIRLGHAAFIAAGGQAELVVLKDIPGNGHFLRNFPGRWHPLADTFLRASVK